MADSMPEHFIAEKVRQDLAEGRAKGVVTRFPPEPNGYLHIGHAKSICLNFGIAEAFGGRCHLRFDDTNPVREEARFAAAIREDVRWLGFDWGEHAYHASDTFETLYGWAERLVAAGKAYVDELSADEIRETRGTLTRPGTPSPHRDRAPEANLELLRAMRAGRFEDGARVLRAKIDMAAPNINLRDPVMYRVLHRPHPRTGDAWCIYPTYDWAHGQCDWIEGVTHSLCTLEFEDHRPLYDWFLDTLIELGADPGHGGPRPEQTEFARLNLTHTVMSKRKLAELVEAGHVDGWSDPRMPTLCGMRRRGYPPEAIRALCAEIGITKYNATTSMALLEKHVRDALNDSAPRRMAVLDPLRVRITNYEAAMADDPALPAANLPGDAAAGTRPVRFGPVLYIEREDFMETPVRKFRRLAPGREVRLRWAYFMTCQEVVKDEAGEVIELRCTFDPATRGGDAPDGRKPKGTIHWVNAEEALEAKVHVYGPLLDRPAPESEPWTLELARDSVTVRTGCRLEPALAEAKPGEGIQFERIGYFTREAEAEGLVFNQTVPLRERWK